MAVNHDFFEPIDLLVSTMIQLARRHGPRYLTTFVRTLPLLCAKSPGMLGLIIQVFERL